MMKILFISAYPLPHQPPKGGVQAVSFNLLKGFANKNDVEVTLVCFQNELEATVKLYPNVRIVYSQFKKKQNQRLFYIGEGRKILKELVTKWSPDVVHFQGNGPHLLLSWTLPPKMIVVTNHGNIWEELKLQRSFKGKLIYFVNLIIENVSGLRIQNYISISEYNKTSFFWKKNIKTAPIIPNPVNPLFFELPTLQIISNKLLFVGNVTAAKGVHILLDAIGLLKKNKVFFDVDIVGPFVDDNFKNHLEKMVVNLELSDQVRFLGPLTQEVLAEKYRFVDVLVLPSFQECLPVSVAEAMAAGRIVIATRVGGISEMIEHKTNGFLFDKGDVGALCNNLMKIHLDHSFALNLAKNSKIAALQSYETSSVVERILKYYRRLKADQN